MRRPCLITSLFATLAGSALAGPAHLELDTHYGYGAGHSPRTPGSLMVQFQPGVTNTTSGITGIAATGATMAGMRLTAHFSGGASEVVTWGATGMDAGGVFGSGWSLIQAGDTFSGAWTLATTSASIDRLVIDAGPGNTVFDTSFFGFFGTDGSAFGRDFIATNGTGEGLDITATYRDAVALTGDAPVGDLFRLLDIDFFTRGVAFGPGTELTFLADTDNLLLDGDINPIPAPLGVGLGAMGLGIVTGATRRRRDQ